MSLSSSHALSRWRRRRTRQDQLVDALIATQSGLDGVLHRHVGAQTHGGQHLQPLDVALGTALGTGNDHPALAEAAGTVGLGGR